MKKLLFLLFVISSIFISYTVCAEGYDGYLFRLNENTPVLLSDDTITYLGDGLYMAQSKEDVQNFVDSESIVTMFPNYTLELFDTEYPYTTSDTNFASQWAHDMIDAWSAREKGVFGDGVKIGIIDSGLNVNHTDLDKEKIVDAYNCMVGAYNTIDVSDSVGHGTHVTGIIAAMTDNGLYTAGIAPGAYICPLKITNSSSLSLANLYAGIKKSIELECDIVNMSLGGAITDKEAINELGSWIKKAQDAGIIVVAAAGNYGKTDLCYPAAYDGVIGVGAVTSSGSLWYKSQMNTSVFVTAPGAYVLSHSNSGSVTTKDGTSMACPHVTATVALIKQLRPQSDIDYIKNLLIETSVDYGDAGYDTSFGHGVINIENILIKMDEYLPALVVSEGITKSGPRIHIHNNSRTGGAAAYFASRENNVLGAVKMLNFPELPKGVTNINMETDYSEFFFWSDKLWPYCKPKIS